MPFVECEGTRCFLRTWGNPREGVRPIVLLHGFAQNSLTWENVAVHLAQAGRFVVALDFPGCGQSSQPASATAYSLTAMARCIDAAVSFAVRQGYMANHVENANQSERVSFAGSNVEKANSAERADSAGKVDLVGYSMGGRAALFYSAFHSERLGSLTLESAGLGPENNEDRAALQRRNTEWAQRVESEGVEAFVDWWEQLPLFSSQRALPEEKRRTLREGRLANDVHSLSLLLTEAGAHQMPLLGESRNLLARLVQNGVEVRYIAGVQDQKYCAVAASLKDMVSAVYIVEDAGHSVHFERPEVFVDLLQ